MQIRKATANEMLALWDQDSPTEASPTSRFFFSALNAGKAVFFALDDENGIVGELYVFFDLEDKIFADGAATAYLCAFRVKKSFRGQGYGRKLMAAALGELRERGFVYATIGVDDDNNESMYRRFGFDEIIKICYLDPCARTEEMLPERVTDGFKLLRKTL